MKIFDWPQGSPEWNAIRAGVVTASELKNLLTDKLAIRSAVAETPQTYLCRKLAERWRGGPLASFMFNTLDTEFGHLKEEAAIPFFELTTGVEVKRVGFIMRDDGLCGCSPDGLLEDSGLEVKCLQDQNHLKYLLAGVLPEEFSAQVHGSMYVTGFQTWHFFGYCPGFPPLLIVVKRDEEIIEKLDEAITDFLARLGAAHQRLVALNGGIEPAINSYRKDLVAGKMAQADSEFTTEDETQGITP